MTRLIAWLERRNLLSLAHWGIDSTARVVVIAHRRIPERAVLAFAPRALRRNVGGWFTEMPVLVLQSCSWSRGHSTTHLTWDVVYDVPSRAHLHPSVWRVRGGSWEETS